MSQKILVVNGQSYAKAIEGLGTIVFNSSEFIRNPRDFELVLFTGGADISPSLYRDRSPKGLCFSTPRRDMQEIAIYEEALKYDIPMAGICRGLQFLNVMAGGTMMHHIDGHEACTHYMTTNDNKTILVNSLHHQMIIPTPNAIITAWSKQRSSVYIGKNDEPVRWYHNEYEAAIFPEIKGFGVQYHPEMMTKNEEGYAYFYEMVINATKKDWAFFMKQYSNGSRNAKQTSLLKLDASAA